MRSRDSRQWITPVRATAALLLVLCLVALPFVYIWFALSLAGTAIENVCMFGGGFAGLVLSAGAALRWPAALFVSAAALGMMGWGAYRDHLYWSTHNAQVCAMFRADPACVEDSVGFTCIHADGSTYGISISVCESSS